jgi:hypothetical protein
VASFASMTGNASLGMEQRPLLKLPSQRER